MPAYFKTVGNYRAINTIFKYSYTMSRIGIRGYDDATEIVRKHMTCVDAGDNITVLMYKHSKNELNHYNIHIKFNNSTQEDADTQTYWFKSSMDGYLSMRYNLGLFEQSENIRPRLTFMESENTIQEIIDSLSIPYTIVKYEMVNETKRVVLSTYEKFGMK